MAAGIPPGLRPGPPGETATSQPPRKGGGEGRSREGSKAQGRGREESQGSKLCGFRVKAAAQALAIWAAWGGGHLWVGRSQSRSGLAPAFLTLLWALPHSALLKPQASSVLPQPSLCVLPLGLKCGVPPSAQGLEGVSPPTAGGGGVGGVGGGGRLGLGQGQDPAPGPRPLHRRPGRPP